QLPTVESWKIVSSEVGLPIVRIIKIKIVIVGARLARAQGDRNGRPYEIVNLKSLSTHRIV
ncbi:MAG: hypothetical protein AAB526_03215, partial [Patescibacteria group bacterium]